MRADGAVDAVALYGATEVGDHGRGGREGGRCGHEPRWMDGRISGILCGEFRRQAEISHCRVAWVPITVGEQHLRLLELGVGPLGNAAAALKSQRSDDDARLSYFRRRKKPFQLDGELYDCTNGPKLMTGVCTVERNENSRNILLPFLFPDS